ncbi:MAG TPA: glutamate-ammonia-ligase adenylyltransferase [Spirochaetia bacterium]|nr:glutamate-ammonia-ligase adenylyltransferase [Spirochaetia bacterium]
MSSAGSQAQHDMLHVVNAVLRLAPELGRKKIESFLLSAPAGYLLEFEPEEISSHISGLENLTEATPFHIAITPFPDALIDVTVIAYDFPAEFAVLTGILGSAGFDILSGAAFTFELSSAEPSANRRAASRRYFSPFGPRPEAVKPSTRIVDRFRGRLTGSDNIEQWASTIRPKLGRFLVLLFSNTDEARSDVKRQINEEVAGSLRNLDDRFSRKLYPVQIEVATDDPSVTQMRVISEDTPFFLFALSNALSIQEISIRRVQIRTNDTQVEDEFYFVDRQGRPIRDQTVLNRVRLSVLLTKQFTYFLNRAPDPYRALLRFENLTEDAFLVSKDNRIEEILTNPQLLQGLARLLGASDFLWEDFLRLQYESILPLLNDTNRRTTLSVSRKDLRALLESRFAEAQQKNSSPLSIEDRREVLNAFKDRESYLVDVDHILDPQLDFFFLSRRLTAIAELVLETSVSLTAEELFATLGTPRTVAGLPARYAILGLGKLGGAALGYASDIEVLFVYSDNGYTDGEQRITNAEFFERLFRESVQTIETKREGIFQVDLRLRPHGNAGPVACSLENFVRYYSPGGEAHSYERLALVRLRRIGGDPELGSQIERIRDELVYTGQSIDLGQIRELRALQLAEKTESDRLNAKFSPGALVDLEYSVQILQVIHGKTNAALRTPRIHKALEALSEAGAIQAEEASRITQAYRFLRTLINGLRMLRGNAKDLFLPTVDSPEYTHLARRMSYEGREDLTPAEELHIEFETRTAAIRAFVETHLGREALPGPRVVGIADMVLAESLNSDAVTEALTRAGFRNATRGYRNLRSLADAASRQNAGQEQAPTAVESLNSREKFAGLAVLAWDMLLSTPDPDMALNNWDQFVRTVEDPGEHFASLLSQPKRLELLLQIFAGSQFLADTLILNPDFFTWVTTPRIINSPRTSEALDSDLRDLRISLAQLPDSREQWLRAIRRFRKREILRIGTRDICLGAEITSVVSELSILAAAIVGADLDFIWSVQDPQQQHRYSDFCVLAFGKLGGRELNYSSDIDLLGVYRREGETESETENALFSRVMEQLRADLSDHNAEGYAYRVDLRLRPYGASGRLVYSLPAIVRYYQESASTWEFQALLKLTPLAGDQSLGWQFLEMVKPFFLAAWDHERILSTISRMRGSTLRKISDREASRLTGYDVKSGRGGIRDIEFTVQGLQLLHSRTNPNVLTASTMTGIERLKSRNLLTDEQARVLQEDYIFLRRVEHFLQLYEDRQVHTLPTSDDARRALALRCSGGPTQPASRDSDEIVTAFFERLARTFDRAHEMYESIIHSPD